MTATLREAVPLLLGGVGAWCAFVAGGTLFNRRASRWLRLIAWVVFGIACLLIGAAIGWTP